MSKDVQKSIHTRSQFLYDLYKFRILPTVGKFEYDDIVDDTNFRRSSERIRDKILTGNVGAGERGLYDFQENEKVTKENSPTDIEIDLRSGKLDKADIQKLEKVFNDKAVQDVETERTKKALEAERKASKDRQDKLDERLGIKTLEDNQVS